MTRTLLVLLLAAPSLALAWTYPLPADDEALVGSLDIATVAEGEALVDVARTHNVGFEAIRLANPHIDSWLLGDGAVVLIPRRFVLPDAPREGIVINVAEMRLYYFPDAPQGEPREVVTHPVSIGRGEWETPIGFTRITRKKVDPTWTPPESVRVAHVERGNPPLPDVVPAGPDNPLGRHALYLDLPSYLLHGTNRPYGIGMRVTHGCIRLYPEDVERLHERVAVGTKVNIVNQAAKAGLQGDRIYLEVHPPYSELGPQPVEDATPALAAVRRLLEDTGIGEEQVNWQAVREAGEVADGIPVLVSATPSEPAP